MFPSLGNIDPKTIMQFLQNHTDLRAYRLHWLNIAFGIACLFVNSSDTLFRQVLKVF